MGVDDEQASLREALKRVAVTLKQAEVPFALAGGYAAWARGGPEPDHDVDFVVTEADAEPADGVAEGRAPGCASTGGLAVQGGRR